MFGALFNARLVATLTGLPPDSPVSGLDVSELIASPAVVATMEPPVRDIIREAVALSSGEMFRLAIPVAVVATIAGLMLRGLPLRDVLPHQQTGPAQPSGDARGGLTLPSPGERSRSADVE